MFFIYSASEEQNFHMKLSQSERKTRSVSEMILFRKLGWNVFLISEVNNFLLKMVVTFNLKFSEIIEVSFFFSWDFLITKPIH